MITQVFNISEKDYIFNFKCNLGNLSNKLLIELSNVIDRELQKRKESNNES